jgi:alpha-galactosidase
LEIQRGASSLLPPEILGAHIAASPNHQTARRLSLSFRAIVALAYHLGVELDPVALSEDDRVELSRWIKLHKDLRPLLHAPDAQFRMAPEDGRYVWGAADNDRMAVFVAQGPQMVAEQPPPLRVPAPQHDDRSWRVKAIHPAEPDFIRVSDMQRRLLRGELSFSIPDLTELGLPLPMLRPESGLILELEPVAGVH